MESTNWVPAIITLAVLVWIAFICCGTLIGLWLCKDNNKWGILIASLALPIIGTIVALIIMQQEYQTIDKWIKQIRKPKKSKKSKKHR